MLSKGLFLSSYSPVRDTNLNLATIQQFWPQILLLLQVHHLFLVTPAEKEGEGSMRPGGFPSRWPWPLGDRGIHSPVGRHAAGIRRDQVRVVRFPTATQLLPVALHPPATYGSSLLKKKRSSPSSWPAAGWWTPPAGSCAAPPWPPGGRALSWASHSGRRGRR